MDIYTGVLCAYAAVGVGATFYALLVFLLKGKMLFEMKENGKTPFRFKVSYVLMMLALFPFLYAAFYKELQNLHK